MLPSQEFHKTSLRLSTDQKRQPLHSMSCSCGVPFQSPWKTLVFSQDNRPETPGTEYFGCKREYSNDRRPGPMARALLKTRKVLRRLSGVKKHGRKLSVDRPSLYNHSEVGSFHGTYYSNPITQSCTPERAAQDLAEEGPVFWATSKALWGLSSSHLDSTGIAELAGGPQGIESSPNSPVSSTKTSTTLCAELESPSWSGYTDHSSDKSAVSTALTSIPPLPSRDLTATPQGSRVTKCSQTEPPSYYDQTSWLLDNQDSVTPSQDANNITTTHIDSHTTNKGKKCPRDARNVASNRVPDFLWPTPIKSVYRPSALNIWIVNVATVKSGSIRPVEISQHVVHLNVK